MAKANGWLRAFDAPIVLADGTELMTLRDSIRHLSEPVPKREQSTRAWSSPPLS